jgi:transforming growth factor-beta-induced protein
MQYLNKLTALSAVALLLVSTSCNNDDDNNNPPAPTPQKTIAETAAADPQFSILVEALTKTNLVGLVADPDADLTVFAPTNAQFEDLFTTLGVADVDGLITALGVDGVANVLAYHVLGAEVKAADVPTAFVKTLATNADDDFLDMYTDGLAGDNSVEINGTTSVTTANIDCSNGVIHVIDGVLLPQSVAQLAALSPVHTSLITALGVADGDLDNLLNTGTGPFTVFAPTDSAFGDLLVELNLPDLNAVVGAIGTDGLANVLLYHVVTPANVRSSDLTNGQVVTAANNGTFTVNISGSTVTITDESARTAGVVAVDIQGTNGVIHVLDKVILPN